MTEKRATSSAKRPVWDDTTRREMADVVAETAARAAAEVVRHFGVDPETHGDDHRTIKPILQWAEARIVKEQARAKFWEGLMEQNAKRIINAVLWFTLAATLLGLSGAWAFTWQKLFN
jgi:hypothetical protein